MTKRKQKEAETKKGGQIPKLESNRYFTPLSFAFLAAALTILFSEFIFSSKMLYGSDMLSAGIFFRSFYVDFVHSHFAIPQWNPYIFGGLPFVDAFHGDLFYPLSIMKFFGSLHRMLGMNLVLHIFLAGLVMYFCGRQFRLSKLPSLFAASTYMFAPYLVSLVAPGHDGKIYVTALFPLTMLFLERGFESKSWFSALFNFSIMGLGIGLIILTPHPQMSYFTLWALGAFTLYRLVRLLVESKSVVGLIRPAALALYAVIIGLGLSAIQFYPGYKYTTEFSPRADSKSGWAWATSWSMHEEEAFSLLVPEFAGVSTRETKTFYWGKNAFKDNSEAVGVVALFMALFGLVLSRKRHRYFLGGMALLAVFYALGATTPIYSLFFYLIPKVSSLRAPSMIMFLFSFSIALLAGMGLQWLMEAKELAESIRKKFKYLLFGFPSLMLLIALAFGMGGKGMLNTWTSLFYSDAGRMQVQQNVTKLDLAYRNLPAIQSGAWLAFLFVAGAAILVLMVRQRKLGVSALLAVILLGLVNDMRFDSRFIGTVEPKSYWESNAVSDYFVREPGYFRVMNFTRAISDNFLPQFGISVVTGYHGNQLRWYDKLLGGPGAPNQANPNLLNLASAKFILLPSGQQLPPDYLGGKPVVEAANFGPVHAVRNDNALPRVFLACQYRVFEDPNMLADTVLNGPNDFQSTVYLEREPGIDLPAALDPTDSAWISSYDPNAVTIDLKSSDNALLVLTDNFYDSWHVEIDGQPGEILRAYGTFRAVPIHAGSKQVVFRYASTRYKTGKSMTLATIFYLLLITGGYAFYHRRSSTTTTE